MSFCKHNNMRLIVANFFAILLYATCLLCVDCALTLLPAKMYILQRARVAWNLKKLNHFFLFFVILLNGADPIAAYFLHDLIFMDLGKVFRELRLMILMPRRLSSPKKDILVPKIF